MPRPAHAVTIDFTGPAVVVSCPCGWRVELPDPSVNELLDAEAAHVAAAAEPAVA